MVHVASKNLGKLSRIIVWGCSQLVHSYAPSSQLGDVMPTDLHVGLDTLGLSMGDQRVASRIIEKFGVSSQVCSLQLKDCCESVFL